MATLPAPLGNTYSLIKYIIAAPSTAPRLDPDQCQAKRQMLLVRGQLMGKTMTGSEQMFLTLIIAAFGLFGVVMAYADVSTASVRDQHKN